MSSHFSQDITDLFSAFDTNERSYNELTENERYHKIKKSWRALDLLSESQNSTDNTIKNKISDKKLNKVSVL
ncbi:hypothetical protein HC728_08490 [Aliivibrio sp. S10_S31]|nr:hypothetical protein [Aliivibrio sp. S10_S31]